MTLKVKDEAGDYVSVWTDGSESSTIWLQVEDGVLDQFDPTRSRAATCQLGLAEAEELVRSLQQCIDAAHD